MSKVLAVLTVASLVAPFAALAEQPTSAALVQATQAEDSAFLAGTVGAEVTAGIALATAAVILGTSGNGGSNSNSTTTSSSTTTSN